MPSKSPIFRLMHIRDCIIKARRFTADLTCEQFCDNELVFYAVTRCLEIISEASRRLPEDMLTRHPDVPWQEMASAGNVYRHDYEDVQQRLIWGVVHERFPALLSAIDDELERYRDTTID